MARTMIFPVILIQFCILFSTIRAVPSFPNPGIELIPELRSQSNQDDPDRTAFHFQATKNWINDPNASSCYSFLWQQTRTSQQPHLVYFHWTDPPSITLAITNQNQKSKSDITMGLVLGLKSPYSLFPRNGPAQYNYLYKSKTGPMYYKGLYHLFYQYNPYGPLWGNLAWGHSVSTDLVNWEALEVALDRTAPFDINGCWSGSVTFVAGQPVILYTGIDEKQRNVQNVAVPKNGSDLLMREWDKPGWNPIMLPVGDIDPDNFRDPATAWFGWDGFWRTAVGAILEGGRAEILLYKSQDFTKWKRNEYPLHKSLSSGMWECPDFFPVSLSSKDGLDPSVNTGNIKHVLKVGLMKTLKDYYLLGMYDEKTDTFVPDEGYEDDYRTWPIIDYGHVYASKSFFDGKKNRRIMWTWVNESDSEVDDVKRGWSGIQTFPRAIWLDTEGKQLIQWPIEEIKSLRKQQVQLHDFALQSGVRHEISGILASQADLEVEFELQSLEGAESFDDSFLLDPSKLCSEIGPFDKGGIGPFGLFVLTSDVEGQEEYTAIYFRIYKSSDKYMTLMCSDLRSSSRRDGVYKPAFGAFVGVDISKDKRISLRTLIDHSVVESFGAGGRTCMTLRVYPKHVLTGGTSGLHAFNHGSQEVTIRKLDAWEMAAARVNIENDDFISKDFI